MLKDRNLMLQTIDLFSLSEKLCKLHLDAHPIVSYIQKFKCLPSTFKYKVVLNVLESRKSKSLPS